MIKRINRYKKIISSIFLLGYFSFIVLTVTHFHGDALSGNNRTPGFTYNISCPTSSDSQDNCQIYHSFSSINIHTVIIAFSSGLLIENCTLLYNDLDYNSNSVDINYLRGPPTLNI